MKNRKFLVPIASLVTALSVSPVNANLNNEKIVEDSSATKNVNVVAQSPFSFVLKTSNDAPMLLGAHRSHSSHSSHGSHSSHSSHYSGY